MSVNVSCESKRVENIVLGENGVMKDLLCSKTESNLMRLMKKQVKCYMNLILNENKKNKRF